MNERKVIPTADIITRQRQAADPGASAWVSANAGSGKTHVLTERVLRLLLTGVAPENLLCLTYTKAAAAEMRRRVSDRLGKWAVAKETDLIAELDALQQQPPAPADLARARTLFGHALETPGGLKINTIHAFCESVLHRFPLEAGVPFGFSVLEDKEQADLMTMARERVIAEGLKGSGPVAPAVRLLFDMLSDSQIETAVATALGDPGQLKAVLADPDAAKRNLMQLTGVKPEETVAALRADILAAPILPPAHYADVLAVTPPKGGSRTFEDKLARIDPRNPDPDLVLNAFLTAKQKVHGGTYFKKSLMDAPGGIGERAVAEAARLEALCARINAVRLVERSNALVDVLGAIHTRYEAKKRAWTRLDFDDLIGATARLLSNRNGQDWVRYKLDAGITHILVDESQDTNHLQWDVVRALVDDFFHGDSTAQVPRTIFAVGDPKQSIYSFQGAEPRLFADTGSILRTAARAANANWYDVPLRASFRTQNNILDAVDRVFADPSISGALLTGGDAVAHESARADKGGSVTLWPPVRQAAAEDFIDRWPREDDLRDSRSAPRIVAERIAGTVRGWIDARRPIGARERAVTADDVLILVQSRGPLFHEIVRALKQHKLDSPGSDKVPVSAHIAVADLLALADVLINPADDLGLAAILRSPLFDIDEDGLYALAAGRGKGVTLWQALRRSELPEAKAAFAQLQAWRGRLDFERPYEFFAHVLYAGGGLRRFHARLGTEVDDVLAEFLDLALAHEQSGPSSLQGFLAAMRQSDIAIKRDLAITGGVRVMTVHGAKGLEAPIVILADAATKPEGSKLGKPVYITDTDPGPLLVHAGRVEEHTLETQRFRDADVGNQKDEYWRKLYVAMTRAEDELYVTGFLTASGKVDDSWYAAIEAALVEDGETVTDADDVPAEIIYPRNRPAPKPIVATEDAPALDAVPFTPAPLPDYVETDIVRPSQARAGEDGFETASESARDADAARREGIALHALLQHLGKVAPEQWPHVAVRALEALSPQHPERYAALANKAIAILEAPANAALFGPGSRAEVPVLAHASREGKPVLIAGRIDRLVVTNDTVLIVDFKSDAAPPQDAGSVPAAYRTQLALYQLVMEKLFPGRAISAALFWTATESLMPVPNDLLKSEIGGFTIE